MGRIVARVLLTGVLTAALLLPGRPAMALTLEHGTTDKRITESMLANTPPSDYEIDKSIQGDAKDGVYNDYFLKDDVQTVSIEVDENNLNYLLQISPPS